MSTGSSLHADSEIIRYLNNMNNSITEHSYGAVLLPLAIHYKYGGANAILKIYQEYNKRSLLISENTLHDIISDGIAANGYTDGFDMAFRAMASYTYQPQIWYINVHSQVNFWNRPTDTVLHPLDNSTRSHTMNALSVNYYEFTWPSEYNGRIEVEVAFNRSGGYTQSYIVTNQTSHSISYNATLSNNTSTYVFTIDGTVTKLGFVICNVNNNSLNYTLNFEYISNN
jgi:hypothetical protein